MRGSVKSQVGFIMSQIDCRGHSKRQATAKVRAELKASGISPTKNEIASITGVHANSTEQNYFGRICELGRYARAEFSLKDLSLLSPEIVTDFLMAKIEEQVSKSHWDGYAAAFGKLDQALAGVNHQPAGRGIKSAINALRREAHAECPGFDGRDRAYRSPARLIAALPGNDMRIVAAIQHECGLRIAEATAIEAFQIKPDGTLVYKGKGGQSLTATLKIETRQALAAHISNHGSLRVDHDAYRAAIKDACKATGERYEASHGLRYSFAQETYHALRTDSMPRLAALGAVAELMGHHRTDITRHYLGGHDD